MKLCEGKMKGQRFYLSRVLTASYGLSWYSAAASSLSTIRHEELQLKKGKQVGNEQIDGFYWESAAPGRISLPPTKQREMHFVNTK